MYVGVSQVFIRFYGCNLNCSFCDTKTFKFQQMTLKEVLENIYYYKDYHSISLTGGEPLLQIDFVKKLVKALKDENRRIYLETNGTLAANLEKVIDYVDIIAMDFKLPTSTHCKSLFNEHKEFLKVALAKKVFAKAVICKSTQLSDLSKAISLVANLNEDIPLVLQPNFFEADRSLNYKLVHFLSFARKYLSCVEIKDQLHKIANWR